MEGEERKSVNGVGLDGSILAPEPLKHIQVRMRRTQLSGPATYHKHENKRTDGAEQQG